jgi:Di-haem oxidoreductase, putative peroxidase
MRRFTRATFVAVLALLMTLTVSLRVAAQNHNGPGGDFSRGNTSSSGSNNVQDPGVRAGTVNAGTALSSLSPMQLQFFQDGLARFLQTDSVSGTMTGEPGIGLGPGFNANSCGGCHGQPAVGGSSPSATAFPFVGPNPQIAAANDYGGTNTVPFFITPDGPVREARFPFMVTSSGALTNTPDGGVHDVFSIAGRQDAEGCVMPQPNFDAMNKIGNLIFRIPTPVFGAGLIENIPDATIVANMNANSGMKRSLGISGHPNYSGNDGSITRFGWKAQNKSLEIFSGEAYNVEIGVTNELFPNERANPPSSCRGRNQLHPQRLSDSQRRRGVLQLHALPRSSCSFDDGNSRQSLGAIYRCRPGDLQPDWLRRVPHHVAADWAVEFHRGAEQSAGRTVFRLAGTQHGLGSRRQRLSRLGGSR